MFLNGCHFIAEPDRDLIDAFPSRNQETRECVPHRVRRNPVAPVGCHVISEGRAEVVPVKPFSMSDIRPKHEWRAQTVRLEEVLKLNRERNRALLTIFKIHGGGFAQMEKAGAEIEPEGSRFDDLLKAQA